MGAKAWMLIASDGDPRSALRARPALDRVATEALVRRSFTEKKFAVLEDGNLAEATSPPDHIAAAGCFGSLSILAAREFGIDRPSQVDRHFVDGSIGGVVHVFAVHSTVDWFAFARWRDGRLERALSLSAEGIIEDSGARLPFEEPFWRGEHADAYGEGDGIEGAPFHPLDLAEAASRELFGFVFEGESDATLVDPFDVPLMRYLRRRPWWRILLKSH
jgi:hypothetical protein